MKVLNPSLRQRAATAYWSALVALTFPLLSYAGPLDSIKSVIEALTDDLKGNVGQAIAVMAVIVFAILLIFGVISLRWGVGLVLGIGLAWGGTEFVAGVWGGG